MLMRFCLLTLLILTFAKQSLAGGGDGIVVDGAAGMPAMTISNPDGTSAGYDGISLQGRVQFPLVESGRFSWALTGVVRYHDLENTKSSNDESEVANHLGPGLGFNFNFGQINLGYEYMMMKARH